MLLDYDPLATLTLGMLCLGGLHVAEQVNGRQFTPPDFYGFAPPATSGGCVVAIVNFTFNLGAGPRQTADAMAVDQ